MLSAFFSILEAFTVFLQTSTLPTPTTLHQSALQYFPRFFVPTFLTTTLLGACVTWPIAFTIFRFTIRFYAPTFNCSFFEGPFQHIVDLPILYLAFNIYWRRLSWCDQVNILSSFDMRHHYPHFGGHGPRSPQILERSTWTCPSCTFYTKL